METSPKFYILQQTDGKGNMLNVFYANENGEDVIFIGKPHTLKRASKFSVIGDAMREAVRLSKEKNGILFKVIPIYDEESFNKD